MALDPSLCQYPACSTPARQADVEFKQWNNDARPVFCTLHDEQIQSKHIPFKFVDDKGVIRDGRGQPILQIAGGTGNCMQGDCNRSASSWCSFCSSKKGRKLICGGHSYRPYSHAPRVHVCFDCWQKWRSTWSRKIWTLHRNEQTEAVQLRTYANARDLPENVRNNTPRMYL